MFIKKLCRKSVIWDKTDFYIEIWCLRGTGRNKGGGDELFEEIILVTLNFTWKVWLYVSCY